MILRREVDGFGVRGFGVGGGEWEEEGVGGGVESNSGRKTSRKHDTGRNKSTGHFIRM